MEKEVPEDLKYLLGEFCETILDLINKYNNRRISRFMVQYNKNDVYIGSNKNGTFDPRYYNPTLPVDRNLYWYVDTEKYCILELKKYIDEVYPNHRLRSFNIFYIGTKKEIYVCKNRLGNTGMNRCKLFEVIHHT